MKSRVVISVAAGWVLIGVLQGAQATFGASLQSRELPLGQALPESFVQTLPWIPVTLAVIALAVRFPISRSTWRSRIPIHVAGALVVAFAANALVVSGFWLLEGTWHGWSTLAREGALWTGIRLHIAISTYAGIAMVTQTLVAHRAARERELHVARVEGQLARARVQALTAQIRPHFLFNTLHTIGQLWRSGRSEEADAVLDHLGALFQRVQDTTARPEVHLAEELEMVRDYLAIEEVRFRDRLRVVIVADPDTLECAIPPLILQPIVENAVRHGISTTSSAGLIEISTSLADGRLRLMVHDDGPGMSAISSRPGSGTGLTNTRERLGQLYGGAAELSFESPAGAGATVRIEIPAGPARDSQSKADPRREAVGV